MTIRIRETIVVCGPEAEHTESVVALLGAEGWNVTQATDQETLLVAICDHRPRAIVYALAHQIAVDLACLALLRQVAPDLPIVVVASSEHGTRAGVPEAAHPLVLEQSPADQLRLREALRAVLRRSRKRPSKLAESAG